MWDERYAEPDWAFGAEANDFLSESFARIPKGRVLCLAEGQGRNAVFLAAQGYDVTAVDVSSVGLDRARALAAERGVSIETVQADLADYDLGDQAWEGIVSIWCHVPEPMRGPLHAKVVAALRPGGVLILESYTPHQLEYGTGGPPHVERLMTADGLRRELDGLQFEHIVERVREVHEGRYHNGPSAVVQVIAKRP